MCDPIGAVTDTIGAVGDVGEWLIEAPGTVGKKLYEGVTNLGQEVIVDPLKDISGASAAEDANALAREQMNEEQAARLQAREDAKTQTATEQMRASRSAGAVRTSAATGGTSLTAATIGEDERDFLGL